MIKVGLLGLGKTGKVVANTLFNDPRFDLVFVIKNIPAKARDFHFVVEPKEMLASLIKKFNPDIIVDFTTPKATLENIKLIPKGKGIVIATTGFTDNQLDEIKKIEEIKILYIPNISSGINILMAACNLIGNIWKEADIEIVETHFKNKKDAPSGTAKKIAKLFIKKEIPIHAIRVGGVVGEHSVVFATETQKIVISHQSFSREVFADGAKKAILFLNKALHNGFYIAKDIYKFNKEI